MAYRGVWGVSWSGLWEIIYPLVRDVSRKIIIVGIAIALFMAVNKWRPLPDGRTGVALGVLTALSVAALWFWIESRIRRHFSNKKKLRKSAPSFTKDL
jgi:hypothetical protein